MNRQLQAKNIIMAEGRINIIDATPIEAAQSGPGKNKDGEATRDPEASWHVKNDSRGRPKSTYGYSVHAGVDEDGFIHRQSVTPGNVHDSQERDTLLLEDEAALYADSAYSSEETRQQRCWMHKVMNGLNCLPKLSWPKAKKSLQDIWSAETKADARKAFDLLILLATSQNIPRPPCACKRTVRN